MTAMNVQGEPAAPAGGAAFFRGNFAPVETEATAFDLEVRGKIPEELSGRLLRIGPNPITAPDPARHHWFIGNGMVHGVRLRDGKAEWYRSRFVLDESAASSLGRRPIPGPGAEKRAGAVNTNLTSVGGKLLALVEAGNLPVELSYELESVARSDFGGSLEAGFTAHPKVEPVSREQLALTYEPGEPVRYISVSPEGRAVTRARIDLPHVPLIHDVAFTASSVVVLDLPVTFQPTIARSAYPWIWDEHREARVGLLPRSGDIEKLQWFEAPRCFVFHFLNAYDQGDLTIVDVVRHARMFDVDHNGPTEGVPVLARWTFDRHRGRLTESLLDDHGCEFPRINGAFGGRPYRYGYTAHWGRSLTFGPAQKHDVERGTTELHDYGPGRVTLEPVFVPRPGAEREDDGWILSYVYDANRNLSDVVILDARDFTGEPVATIRLPVRVPFGFHGGWAHDSNLTSPIA